MRVLPILLGLLLAACQTNPFSEVPERLGNQVRTFEDVVRWGALQKMYVFLKPDPERAVEIPLSLDNVRVTGYELASPLTEVGPWRWRQTAVIDYVLTDRQVVRQLTDHQVWFSEDEGKHWYRAGPLPQFL